MSPSNADNDPVHKGLHDLGRQIEESEGVSAGPPAAGDEPLTADEERGRLRVRPAGRCPTPSPGPDPGTPDPDDAANSTLAAPHAGALQDDPENNPVERGLHQLGRQIDKAEQRAPAVAEDGGEGAAMDADPLTPRRRRSARPDARLATSSARSSWFSC